MGKHMSDLRIITCHLGNGSSVSAIKGGRSIDTTMGFTPLSGLIMGTRTGDIDPAIVPFLMNKTGMNYDEVDAIMNKKSGKEQEISAEGSKVKIFVIPTNEEIMIARDTQRITASLKK